MRCSFDANKPGDFKQVPPFCGYCFSFPSHHLFPGDMLFVVVVVVVDLFFTCEYMLLLL